MKLLKFKTLVFGLLAANLVAGELKAEEDIPTKITLIFEDRLLTLDFRTHPEILQQTPSHFLVVGDNRFPVSFGENLPPSDGLARVETEFKTTVDPEALAAFFRTTSLVSQREAEPVKLTL